MLQLSNQPCFLKVANHNPFAPLSNLPMVQWPMAAKKEVPSGAITNDVHQGIEHEAEVMTQGDPQVSANLCFLCTLISI